MKLIWSYPVLVLCPCNSLYKHYFFSYSDFVLSMKTKTMGLFTLPVLAAILIASAITPALAEGANPEQAADIQMDEGCSLNTGLSAAGLNEFGTATATDA